MRIKFALMQIYKICYNHYWKYNFNLLELNENQFDCPFGQNNIAVKIKITKLV
jgi:hypothetical protein